MVYGIFSVTPSAGPGCLSRCIKRSDVSDTVGSSVAVYRAEFAAVDYPFGYTDPYLISDSAVSPSDNTHPFPLPGLSCVHSMECISVPRVGLDAEPERRDT